MRNLGKRKTSRIKEIFVKHIQNNARQYAIILLLFLIGLIFGIIFVNNSSQTQIEEVTTYINEFVNSIKSNMQIDKGNLLKNSLISNFILAISLWFIGSTVIGIPIVYGIIVYRGFCLGYTISTIMATLGLGKRNFIYNYIYIITKHNIYSVYFSISS